MKLSYLWILDRHQTGKAASPMNPGQAPNRSSCLTYESWTGSWGRGCLARRNGHQQIDWEDLGPRWRSGPKRNVLKACSCQQENFVENFEQYLPGELPRRAAPCCPPRWDGCRGGGPRVCTRTPCSAGSWTGAEHACIHAIFMIHKLWIITSKKFHVINCFILQVVV